MRVPLVRFVALLVDRELCDRVQEQSIYTTDAAWDSDCDECTAFASRVSAGVRRFRAAMREGAAKRTSSCFPC